jgi:hypothetical protein
MRERAVESDFRPIGVAMSAMDDAAGGFSMDYLPPIVIIGGLSGCVIAAYELFDAIERDEQEHSSAPTGHAPVDFLDAPPAGTARVRPPAASVRQGNAVRSEHVVGAATAYADQLEIRICDLQARLERLEHECDRVGVLALAVRAQYSRDSASDPYGRQFDALAQKRRTLVRANRRSALTACTSSGALHDADP